MSNVIHFVKGDTFKCSLTITDEYGQEYSFEEGDKLYLTVRSNPNMPPCIKLNLSHGIEISEDNVVEITFVPRDTKKLDANYKYKYDLELVKANKETYTVISETEFSLIPEYTTVKEEV